MVLKIYGANFSVATQTVLVALKEVNQPYELVHIDLFKGEHKDANYVASKHPFAQIPVLVSRLPARQTAARVLEKSLIHPIS